MKKEFLPYEEALALKELGFKEPCIGWYFTPEEKVWLVEGPDAEDNNCESVIPKEEQTVDYSKSISAPLYQQVSFWLFKVTKGKVKFIIDPQDTENEKLDKLKSAIQSAKDLLSL